jgi:serine/threonine-protein phosphatase 4 regulatory subunit 1
MIYVFKDDERGPPGELINLFVGDPDMWDREASLQGTEEQTAAKESTVQSAYDEFFLDPERPLICAFNFPAVTATLGRERWSELRDYYHFLSRDQHRKVRLTLGASLGEIAKIVGPDNAVLDVLPLWWNCVKHEDPDVRLKVVSAECLKVLLDALDKETKLTMMQGLKDVWVENLTGWKEREALAGVVKDLVVDLGEDGRDLWELILKALEDDVAIIREYAITAVGRHGALPLSRAVTLTFLPQVPVFLKIHGSSKPAANLFLHDLDRLCQSTSFRRRATYVIIIHYHAWN